MVKPYSIRDVAGSSVIQLIVAVAHVVMDEIFEMVGGLKSPEKVTSDVVNILSTLVARLSDASRDFTR